MFRWREGGWAGVGGGEGLVGRVCKLQALRGRLFFLGCGRWVGDVEELVERSCCSGSSWIGW